MRGHRHRPPGTVGRSWHELVPVAGARAGSAHARLRAASLPSGGAGARTAPSRTGDSSGAGEQAVPAQVVVPALEDREVGAGGRASGSRLSASSGRSRSTSWRCRAMVAVATTTGRPVSDACSTAGTRYASDLPVPVPACTSRWVPSVTASQTAWAMTVWPVRSVPPMALTAVARSAWTGESPPRVSPPRGRLRSRGRSPEKCWPRTETLPYGDVNLCPLGDDEPEIDGWLTSRLKQFLSVGSQ